jgi:hypothetical protein
MAPVYGTIERPRRLRLRSCRLLFPNVIWITKLPVGLIHPEPENGFFLAAVTWLFLLQCEGVDIIRSHVAEQHWPVVRIEAHPKRVRPCEAEPFQVDNTLRIAT